MTASDTTLPLKPGILHEDALGIVVPEHVAPCGLRFGEGKQLFRGRSVH